MRLGKTKKKEKTAKNRTQKFEEKNSVIKLIVSSCKL